MSAGEVRIKKKRRNGDGRNVHVKSSSPILQGCSSKSVSLQMVLWKRIKASSSESSLQGKSSLQVLK
ncbi:hypothetical protein L1987_55546 [Smallanthus sonchifolius]|uniref:Uncharacterized protein n=1 Tax=Smallanthus sonchifolius TaxID=185202 RepID=A0ACB9EAM6_9ASTR|nr:hypothetical protein L1987_55546 [Smallanthus sonchifolius]